MPPSEEYLSLRQAALAAEEAGDTEKARRLWRAAVTLDSGQKDGWLALARLERSPQKKAQYYQRVLRLDPDDPVALAYLEGMRDAAGRPTLPQKPGRSHRALGLAALLVLLLGGSLALLVSQFSQPREGDTLPTLAVLPSVTPTGESLAQPQGAAITEAQATSSPTHTATPTRGLTLAGSSGDTATPVTFAPPTITPTQTPTTEVQTFSLPSPTPPPTVIFVPPPPTASGPTSAPGGAIPTVVTVIPTATRASTLTPTEQPMFMDATPSESPTGFPVFATPTPEYRDDFNTPVPPTMPTYTSEPFSGGGKPPTP